MNEDRSIQAITSSPETRVAYLDEQELPSVDKREFDRVNLDPSRVYDKQWYEFVDDAEVKHEGSVEHINLGTVGRETVDTILIEEKRPAKAAVSVRVHTPVSSDERKIEVLLGWHILREGR